MKYLSSILYKLLPIVMTEGFQFIFDCYLGMMITLCHSVTPDRIYFIGVVMLYGSV